MSNPTALPKYKTVDFSGLAIKVSQIQDEDGVVVGGIAQQATIADLVTNNLSTSNTYTDAAVNAKLTLIDAKVNAILAALENAGILADA